MVKLDVHILGISCGHRKNRNTSWLVRYALKAAEKFGRRVSDVVNLTTDFEDLADKNIKPCLNCDERWEIPNLGLPYKGTEMPKPRGCIIKNDYMKVLWPKIEKADGFIFGSPVYTLSYTSKFRLLTERFAHGIWQPGHLSGKPVGAVTTATMPIGGQESCLMDMNNVLRAVEMIPVSWVFGAPGVSGPPYGPLPDGDDGHLIGQKKHRYGNWLAVLVGRRVAEFAVMLKIAKGELGDLYKKEFLQILHPPHGDESWAWDKLDSEDEEYMQNIIGGEEK